MEKNIERLEQRPVRFEKGYPFSVSMLSWAYNEEENIVDFLKRAKKFLDDLNIDYEHILVDDGCSDRTYELALECQRFYPRLRVLRNDRNLGPGWNIYKSVAAATKDVLFWQTVDWSYDIRNLPEYLWLLRDFDVLQGVRVTPSSARFFNHNLLPLWLKNIRVARRSDKFHKAIISIVNYLLIRFLSGVPVLDFQNVTVYPRKLAQSIELESRSAFTNPELLIKAYWRGASIKQIPIDFIARTRGTAKGTKPKAVISAVLQVTYYCLRWRILGLDKKGKRGTIAPVESDASTTALGQPQII